MQNTPCRSNQPAWFRLPVVVFLPGAMTGMILAGANPLDAVRLQIVVMFMLLAGNGSNAETE